MACGHEWKGPSALEPWPGWNVVIRTPPTRRVPDIRQLSVSVLTLVIGLVALLR